MWYKNVGLRQNASSVKTLKATTRGRFYPSIVYVKEMWVYINYRRVCGYTHYTRYLLDNFKLIMTPPRGIYTVTNKILETLENDFSKLN